VDWKKVEPAAFAATQLARLTGDRSRDLPDSIRAGRRGAAECDQCQCHWIEQISSVVELDKADERRAFGESLPAGLRLRQPEVADLAASYGVGLAKNHPFVDGNKRVAFLAVGLFLALNGRRLVASQADATLTMLAVAAGQIDEEKLARWLREHSAPF
jgi:hypothetical protein